MVAGPAHGDVLLATPLLTALRRACPDAILDVLVYRGQSGILEGNPDVDEVLTASKHPGFREYLRLARRIVRKYDLAISTKYTDRAVLYAMLAGRFRMAIVPGDTDAWKRRLTHASVPYDHYREHTIVQNNALAELLGIPAWHAVRPPVAADAGVLTGLLPAEVLEAPFAVMHLNPGVPYKRWTAEGWAAVAGYLAGRRLPVVLTGDGSNAEMAYMKGIVQRMPVAPIDLSGKLRFADVTGLLTRCAVYVGTDTVTSHIAAAVGVPTVVLFGPESPSVWGPWPAGFAGDVSPFPGSGDQRVGNVLVLQTAVPCPTCRQGHCLRRSEKDRSCNLMLTLEQGQVIRGVERMLERIGDPDESPAWRAPTSRHPPL
ncbi:MAG: glycosyltransferase family 9 protein [Planctomycetaceae bacterium]